MPDGPPARAETEIERFWEWVDEPLASRAERREPGEPAAPHLRRSGTVRDRAERPAAPLRRPQGRPRRADAHAWRRGSASRSTRTRWPALVEAATFDRMRANADRVAPDATNRIWQDNQQFFHRGTSGQWRSLLDDADARALLRAGCRARARRHRALAAPRRGPRVGRRHYASPVASLLRFWRRSPPGPAGGAPLPRPDPTLHPVGGPSTGRGPNQLSLLRHWGLRPSARVLEIGCGVGRLAYELASYLDGGSYTGFDISPEGHRLAQRALRPPAAELPVRSASTCAMCATAHGAPTPRRIRFPVRGPALRRRVRVRGLHAHAAARDPALLRRRSRGCSTPDGFAAVDIPIGDRRGTAAADAGPRMGGGRRRASARSSPRRPDARSRTTTRSCARRSPRPGWSSPAR